MLRKCNRVVPVPEGRVEAILIQLGWLPAGIHLRLHQYLLLDASVMIYSWCILVVSFCRHACQCMCYCFCVYIWLMAFVLRQLLCGPSIFLDGQCFEFGQSQRIMYLQDWLDIDFGIAEGVDFIAISFVKSAEVINHLKSYIKARSRDR